MNQGHVDSTVQVRPLATLGGVRVVVDLVLVLSLIALPA
jgi:hypothetical protein